MLPVARKAAEKNVIPKRKRQRKGGEGREGREGRLSGEDKNLETGGKQETLKLKVSAGEKGVAGNQMVKEGGRGRCRWRQERCLEEAPGDSLGKERRPY